MIRTVRRISLPACLLLVLLRVAIGWQFLYEGLWKLGTRQTSRPWSAEGYLANARGPFREKFRAMVDDPDGLARLDYDTVSARWDDWKQRFVAHYTRTPNENLKLTDAQQKELDRLLDGPTEFAQVLAELPEGVDLKKFKPLKYKPPEGWYLRYNAKAKRLETNLHLTPEERDSLLRLAGAPSDETTEGDVANADNVAAADDAKPTLSAAAKKYQDAIRRLYDRTSRLSLRERLQVLLKEDAERVGLVQEKHAGTSDYERPGKKQVYQHLLARYEENLKKAGAAKTFLEFQHDHLDKQWRELQEKKAELVGPVDALTAELQNGAYKLLTVEQAGLGPVPDAPTQVSQVNQRTIWALTILGALLIVGLFSRLSALGAAVLLFLFYLPVPPWPGVPELPGPEHSLIVNKNLIECIACLALACLPTGRWIGLDALVRRFVFFRKTD